MYFYCTTVLLWDYYTTTVALQLYFVQSRWLSTQSEDRPRKVRRSIAIECLWGMIATACTKSKVNPIIQPYIATNTRRQERSRGLRPKIHSITACMMTVRHKQKTWNALRVPFPTGAVPGTQKKGMLGGGGGHNRFAPTAYCLQTRKSAVRRSCNELTSILVSTAHG